MMNKKIRCVRMKRPVGQASYKSLLSLFFCDRPGPYGRFLLSLSLFLLPGHHMFFCIFIKDRPGRKRRGERSQGTVERHPAFRCHFVVHRREDVAQFLVFSSFFLHMNGHILVLIRERKWWPFNEGLEEEKSAGPQPRSGQSHRLCGPAVSSSILCEYTSSKSLLFLVSYDMDVYSYTQNGEELTFSVFSLSRPHTKFNCVGLGKEKKEKRVNARRCAGQESTSATAATSWPTACYAFRGPLIPIYRRRKWRAYNLLARHFSFLLLLFYLSSGPTHRFA